MRRSKSSIHNQHVPFSSPLSSPHHHPQSRRHVTVTAFSSPRSGHVELALNTNQQPQNEKDDGIKKAGRLGYSDRKSIRADKGNDLFQIYDETCGFVKQNNHGYLKSRGEVDPPPPPPPPSTGKSTSRKPLKNVSNKKPTRALVPTPKNNNLSVSSGFDVEKSRKWEERLGNLGLDIDPSFFSNASSTVSSKVNGCKNSSDVDIDYNGFPKPNSSNSTGTSQTADYIQFDLNSTNQFRGTKLSPRSQGGLFSPSSRDKYHNFNGTVEGISDRQNIEEKVPCGGGTSIDLCEEDVIGSFDSNCAISPQMDILPATSPVAEYDTEHAVERSHKESSMSRAKINEENYIYKEGSEVIQRKNGTAIGSPMNITVQVKRKLTPNNGKCYGALNQKPPLHKDFMNQSQSSSATFRSQYSSQTSSNEISECVADIIDQSPHLIHSCDSNSTREVLECVQDIMEQTIASETSLENFEKRKNHVKNYPLASSFALAQSWDGSESTEISAQIAECVHDLLDASTHRTPPKADYCSQTSAEITECIADIMEQSDESVDTNDEQSYAAAFELDTTHIKKEQRDRVGRLLQTITTPPPPPPKYQHSAEVDSSKRRNGSNGTKQAMPPTYIPSAMSVKDAEPSLVDLDQENHRSSSKSISRTSSSSRRSKSVDTPDNSREKHLKNGSEMSGNVEKGTLDIQEEPFKIPESRVSLCDKAHLERLSAKASHFLSAGNFDDALEIFSDLLQCQKSLLGHAHPLVASTHHNIGVVHTKCASKASRMEEEELFNILAIKSFRKAASIARKTLGSHPNVAVSLVRIGLILLQVGQYDDAVVTFQECLRIRQKAFGDKHPLVAKVYNNLGVAYLHVYDYERGLKAFESAKNIQRQSLKKLLSQCGDDLEVYQVELILADTLSNIGSICLDWIEFDKNITQINLLEKALQSFDESLAIRERRLGADHELVRDVQLLKSDALDLIKATPLASDITTCTTVSILHHIIPSNISPSNLSHKVADMAVRPSSFNSKRSFAEEESCLVSDLKSDNCIASPWDEGSIISSTGAIEIDDKNRQIIVVRPVDEYAKADSGHSHLSNDSEINSIKGVDEIGTLFKSSKDGLAFSDIGSSGFRSCPPSAFQPTSIDAKSGDIIKSDPFLSNSNDVSSRINKPYQSTAHSETRSLGSSKPCDRKQIIESDSCGASSVGTMFSHHDDSLQHHLNKKQDIDASAAFDILSADDSKMLSIGESFNGTIQKVQSSTSIAPSKIARTEQELLLDPQKYSAEIREVASQYLQVCNEGILQSSPFSIFHHFPLSRA
mmetsp:Transcript_19910/g.30122  ORF Transcript_19910/g.30122 Transcript_19910/m.30122 type:complete len:1296 (-) Transcript_19910:1057-4944(-)